MKTRNQRIGQPLWIGFWFASILFVAGCGEPELKIQPKMQCRSPNGLRDNKTMFQWKYDRVREVILEVLPEGDEGMAFPEFRDLAEEQFKSREREDIGKLSWFVETVALEMEMRGELERFPATTTPTPLPKNIRRIPITLE